MGGIIENGKTGINIQEWRQSGRRKLQRSGDVMGNRILARVWTTRLRWWAEHLQLLDGSQERSAADATQIMVRIWWIIKKDKSSIVIDRPNR